LKFIISIILMTFAFIPMAKADENDFTCLVEAIYHEARSEPLMGMIAVANTILNRVYSKRYPNTICGVVHQGKYWEGHPVKNKCQFSYWCDGKPEMFNDMVSLKKSIAVAEMSLMGVVMRDTLNSTHYHATYVKPDWSKKSRFIRLDKIGKHIFYLDKGK